MKIGKKILVDPKQTVIRSSQGTNEGPRMYSLGWVSGRLPALFRPASQHVFPVMQPNNWKNEAMWLQGHIDDWFDRGGRTIVKLPEEGRDPPTIFVFRINESAQSHQFQSLRMLQYRQRLLSDYARHHISLHDYKHNIERLFSHDGTFLRRVGR